MADTVAGLLRRSLAHLATEVPSSHRRMREVLGPLAIELDVDGERFTLCGEPMLRVVAGPAQAAAAWITIPRSTILDVLDAEVTLADAVESGRLAARGHLDDLLRAYDTLMAYLHAAVRAPSTPDLLAELRAGPVETR